MLSCQEVQVGGHKTEALETPVRGSDRTARALETRDALRLSVFFAEKTGSLVASLGCDVDVSELDWPWRRWRD